MGRRSPLTRTHREPADPPHQVCLDHRVAAVPAHPDPIVLATDASVTPNLASSGYLSTTGHTGLRAHAYPSHLAGPRCRVVATELRAVYWGLTTVLDANPGRPVEIRVDNLQALGFLRRWQRGDSRMPQGYDTHLRPGGERPSLLKLQMLAEYTPHLRFRHEKAHVGHPLNETADSLAKLGLRCIRGRVPESELPRLVPLWAAGALEEYGRRRRALRR
jgi:ribonuclease HI